MPPPNFTELTLISPLGGSTGAKLYKDPTGKKWVVKTGAVGSGGFEQVKSESIAHDVYELAGVRVPKHYLDMTNKALMLEYIEGKSLAEISSDPVKLAKAKGELCRGFIMDALLANWDVIGMHQDNILIPNDGSSAVRIDGGGSLTFRAMGGPKGEMWNELVNEINTIRQGKTSSFVFGGVTDEEIKTQITTIIKPNFYKILCKVPHDLRPMIHKRLNTLLKLIGATMGGKRRTRKSKKTKKRRSSRKV